MNNDRNLAEVFVAARRLESALALAIQAGDDCVETVAAARLALTLRRAAAALEAGQGESSAQRATTIENFAHATRGMYELLSYTRANPQACDPERLTRWAVARQRSQGALGGPHVFELDAAGFDLSGAQFLGIHVSRCRLITSLKRSHFEEAVIEDTDLTYSDLRDSLWRGTEVYRSALRYSCLVNASLERTTFRGCDLRDADLAAGPETTRFCDVRFVDCDLRGVNWGGRDLSRVAQINCRTETVFDCAADRVDRVRDDEAEGGRRVAGTRTR